MASNQLHPFKGGSRRERRTFPCKDQRCIAHLCARMYLCSAPGLQHPLPEGEQRARAFLGRGGGDGCVCKTKPLISGCQVALPLPRPAALTAWVPKPPLSSELTGAQLPRKAGSALCRLDSGYFPRAVTPGADYNYGT